MDIHYFAAARAAAGTDRESVDTQADTLDGLLNQLASAHTGTTDAGMPLGEVFSRCSFLIDGRKSERTEPIAAARRVDILPPFAGG